MLKRSIALQTLAVLWLSTAPSFAQHQHGGHSGHGAPASASGQGTSAPHAQDADGMMNAMRRMMPMMERMRSASPQERERLMSEMRPMMREMMPMMQAMMGSQGMGGGHGGMMGHGSQGTGGGHGGMMGHGNHGQGQPPTSASASASTRAFEEVNARMHRDMAIAFTGNADIDFVRGMIPHHQGAIDMARVLLQHGKDETTRKWANDIIREQEREIAEMREWLTRNAR
jgi:hypothetical protein